MHVVMKRIRIADKNEEEDRAYRDKADVKWFLPNGFTESYNGIAPFKLLNPRIFAWSGFDRILVARPGFVDITPLRRQSFPAVLPGFVVDFSVFSAQLDCVMKCLAENIYGWFPEFNRTTCIFPLNQIGNFGGSLVLMGPLDKLQRRINIYMDCQGVALEFSSGARCTSSYFDLDANAPLGGPLGVLRRMIVPEKEALKPRRDEIKASTDDLPYFPDELLDLIIGYDTFDYAYLASAESE
jgi:hypothetical protein